MGRGAGGYVNLLSHSPVNTPCPGYRYRESREALLDEVAPLVATTPPATCDLEGRTDALCPVQIHVQDPAIRERRRQTAEQEDLERKWVEDRSRRWIDLDENVLDGYILIDDACLEPTAVPDETQEIPYPEGAVEVDDDEDDADSHGKDESSIYSRARRGASRRPREDFDLSTTYPLANSHGNAYRESSSHTRYSELYSELAVRNYLEANREDVANYSVANSHGDHSVSSENRERSFRENAETDQLAWDTRQHANYEVANSHSNYRVFYDSQTQQRELLQTSGWPIESWREHLFGNSHVSEDKKQKSENVEKVDESEKTDRSEGKSDPNIEPTCDIEQCLVQIEESLLNIEQNLLHVQDLDIPELRNLLYKSPSIEKSLYEVQDLLYADGIVPVINKRKSSTLESEEEDEDEEEDEEEEEEEEEEVWTDRNLTAKDNDNEDDDPGAGGFDASNEESSDTANAEENNRSGSMDNRSNPDCVDGSAVYREEAADTNYADKAMNFVPNSLNKTLPRRIVLDGAKENIRLCSSGPEEPTTVDYNLNTSCAEKKPFCRDKCHSRTNSLDENSTFPNLDSSDRHETGKSSLQNLLFESTTNNNFLDLFGKARSEEMLQTQQNRSSRAKRGLREKHWTMMEAKTEDFRKKLESISSNRCFSVSGVNDQKRVKLSKDLTANTTRSREKSPAKTRRSTGSVDKLQDKEKESAGGKGFDKRKRKKMSSRSQSTSENALVPSKLISLSLSLLLAALLQAVRCLTDLVEDAFRSASYDRSGLLQ